MNERPQVSIIVPVYNAEKYIGRCIESILAQSFTDYELICVDDGSTDRTGAICDEYVDVDRRIRVIHIKNHGVSFARNVGISTACGEYVLFVDADDWLEKERIKQMLPSEDEDFVYAGYINVAEDKVLGKIQYQGYLLDIAELRRDFERQWAKAPLYFVWCSLYKREILENHMVSFDDEISLGEDVLFNIAYLEKCKRIRISTNCGYYHNNIHTSLVHRYVPNREEKEERECKCYEHFSGCHLPRMRWYGWHVALAYYKRWNYKLYGREKRENKQRIASCYRNEYFRECIGYIRAHGTLDERIETYFMRGRLYPIYLLLMKCIVFASKTKRIVKKP